MRLEESHPLMYRRKRRVEQQAERHRAAVGVDVSERLAALHELLTAGTGRLPDEQLADARELHRRAGERLRMSGSHTVVALAGATGSGKSSIFNALSGVAAVHGRGAPADHRRRARGDLGRRRAPGRCWTGCRSRAGTTSTSPRSPTRATTGWTGWCCWTCPTTTRPPSRTGWRWTGWSTWSTCWCGCWTRRSTPTRPCTSGTCARWPGTPG